MNNKYIGLIECGMPDRCFAETSASLPQDFQVKKAFAFYESAKPAIRKRFPELELTADCNAILNDDSISHVLISAPSNQHRGLIGAALKANKHVQIV